MRKARPSHGLKAFAVAAAGLLAAAAGPSPGFAGPQPPRRPIFITEAELDPASLLPPPPADGSAAQKAEIAELQRIGRTASASRWDQAKWDADHEDPTVFAALIAPGFDLKAHPATARLLGEVRNDEAVAATWAKNHFLRTRPWAADPALRTCDRNDPPNSSFPSGHATMGFALAVVLGRLEPDKAPMFLARAQDYAQSRLICAAHYRSDIVAGEALGTGLALMLLADPRFQADFATARAELVAAHLAGG